MNETEANELYQKIFSPDRLERWESWKGYCNTEGHLPEGVNHPLAGIPKKKGPWRGGMTISGKYGGYRLIFLPDHPKASKRDGYIGEHILAAEIALGRFLPDGAVVHHVNEKKLDNYSQNNLVICESRAAHNLLHKRMRALMECGHADWLWCGYCKKWDSPENLPVRWYRDGTTVFMHAGCQNVYQRAYRARSKELELAVD